MTLPSEPCDQTLLGHRPFHARGRMPGSARIALYPRSCGLAVSGPSSASFSSSPSNRSLNCTGSLYGASSQSGLGGFGIGAGLATSRSISQPLADDAPDCTFGPFYIVHPESDSIAVPKIELGKVAMKVFLAHVLNRCRRFHASGSRNSLLRC